MRRTTARFFVKSALPARKPPPVTVLSGLEWDRGYEEEGTGYALALASAPPDVEITRQRLFK
jgi:hypothetical protein